MGNFLNDNRTVWGIMAVMLTVIGWMAMEGLENNTKAMERLSCSLDRIEERIGSHDVLLKEHAMDIKYHDARLKKGGL